MQAVSVAPASFKNRKSLPKAWQGLRDEQLSEAARIPDCVFVHASGASPAALPQHSVLCAVYLHVMRHIQFHILQVANHVHHINPGRLFW